MVGPQKVMRRPLSFPRLYSWLGPLLSVFYITCLLGDCELSHWCLKSWGMSWGLGIGSENCRMIHPQLDENLKCSKLTYKHSSKDSNASPLLSLDLSHLFDAGDTLRQNWYLCPQRIHVAAGPAVMLQCNVPRVGSKVFYVVFQDIWHESFQLQMGFHFHSYVLTIYVRLYWILELVVLNSLVRRGYIRKIIVQLVQIVFSRVCSTDSSSCSERKNWKKTRLKQGSKTKEGKSKHFCLRQFTWFIIALLSNRYHSAVAPILLRCRSVVAPMLQRYCTATVPLSLRRCRSVVALLSHRYHTDIVPLSLFCCCSCCRYTVAPLSHRCRAVVEPQPLRPREGINNSILKWCCSTVTPMLLLLSIGRFTRLSPQEE